MKAADDSLKPRVAAVARNAAEVVRFAGGWLFDQAMAGWEVNVLTLEDGDVRSLRILGAHRHDLAPVLESRSGAGSCLRAIAIPGELYRCDPGVRKIASRALAAAPGELLLWGDDVPADLGSDPGLRLRLRRAPVPVLHRLSFAARAFKAQALAAARVPEPGEAASDAESFVSVK
ncbi:MAG TPA: hypothetical protein VMU95_37070 [Trebonia sp.]|nr:hypothetical protein [Trebonia sp.]